MYIKRFKFFDVNEQSIQSSEQTILGKHDTLSDEKHNDKKKLVKPTHNEPISPEMKAPEMPNPETPSPETPERGI